MLIDTVDGSPVNVFGVSCSYCGAVAGEQCGNKVTGMPLRRAVAHPRRVCDAVAAADAEGAEN